MERAIKAQFGVDTEIRQAIAYKMPVGATVEATIFLNAKKQLFMYITSQSRLTYGDVRKIVSKVGLKADMYIPPKGIPNYFDEVGRRKFFEVFPGRKNVSAEDIIYYKTLAPYSPALVLISEVTNGTIYQFDSDSNTKWRPAVRFAYRRIRTSLNM